MPSFWDMNFRHWVTGSPYFEAVQCNTYPSSARVSKI